MEHFLLRKGMKGTDQRKYKASESVTFDANRLRLRKVAVWIPDDCIDLKLPFFTLSHEGNAGHRGSDPNFNYLLERFIRNDQLDDAKAFVSYCLLCVLGKTANKVQDQSMVRFVQKNQRDHPLWLPVPWRKRRR